MSPRDELVSFLKAHGVIKVDFESQHQGKGEHVIFPVENIRVDIKTWNLFMLEHPEFVIHMNTKGKEFVYPGGSVVPAYFFIYSPKRMVESMQPITTCEIMKIMACFVVIAVCVYFAEVFWSQII